MRPVHIYPSANFNGRYSPVDMLVLHYTGMKTGQEALDRLCNPAAAVSAHYLIFENGDIYNLVDEEFRAWHAGLSQWRGVPDVNSRAIGIEIVNPGHEFGYIPFTNEQIQSVIDLCRDIMTRHHIAARNILGHSDVAPMRKSDPGELFPWKNLAENSIGLWTDEFEIPRKPVGEMLAQIGYDTIDELAALTAFQRHFYPEALLNGSEKTIGRLAAVSRLYQEKGSEK